MARHGKRKIVMLLTSYHTNLRTHILCLLESARIDCIHPSFFATNSLASHPSTLHLPPRSLLVAHLMLHFSHLCLTLLASTRSSLALVAFRIGSTFNLASFSPPQLQRSFFHVQALCSARSTWDLLPPLGTLVPRVLLLCMV